MVKKTVLFAIHSLFFFCIFFAIFVIVFVYYLNKQDNLLQNKVYPNVYIDKKPFGKKSAEEIRKYFKTKDTEAQRIKIVLKYHDEPIATVSGQTLALHHNSEIVITNAFAVGRSDKFISKINQRIGTLFDLTRYDFESSITYDPLPINNYLDDLANQHDIEPENALFNYENGRVTAFKVEVPGVKVNKSKALEDINASLLQTIGKNITLEIGVDDVITMPEITLKMINNFGIIEKIGEGKSDYTGSIPGRIHNVILASSKFDGVLIPQGETFSFNQILGEVTSKTGYQPAYIIQGGRTVLGDGGGVCQVSTTMFRAALNTGLPIVKRTAHAYRVHYYENDQKPGLDATVFSPSVDLKFTNDTPAHILIQRELDTTNRLLKFTFYGKKDDRIAEMSPITVYDIRPAPAPLYQDDPTLKKGIVKQVDWAAVGTKARFHYKVVKQEQIIADQDFFSNYRPWQAVYLVGTGE